MTIGELLERGYVKKVGVYTATGEDDVFIDIYKGSREEIPSAILELTVKNWGITKGYVDINIPLPSEEEIQALLNALAQEYGEKRREIVRKISRNFAKNINPTPPDQ